MPVATTTEGGRQALTPAAEKILNDRERRRRQAASAPDVLPEQTIGAVPLATLPEPPAKPTRPTNLSAAAPWLLKPFHRADVEIKISATNREKSRGLVAPYADMRVYFTRLDQICGVENWSHTITLGQLGSVCALTIFGVTKSAAGDYPIDTPGRPPEENKVTSAEAQAFKRACAAFGLGRYLYTFQETWAPLTEDGKKFIDPAGIVDRLYATLPKGD